MLAFKHEAPSREEWGCVPHLRTLSGDWYEAVTNICDNLKAKGAEELRLCDFVKIIFIHLTRGYKFCNITYTKV